MASLGVAVESVDKQCDEVALAGFLFGLGFLHRLDESCIALVVGECLDDIGHAHFEDDIHAAFEVKTESDACLKALLVRVDAEILHRILVVLLCNGIFNLRCLAVIVLCGNREREVEDARQRQ